jgi:class 3 adenylate cyclase
MSELPSGAVTFLLTDVEGSTKRWQADSAAMEAAIEEHDGLVRRLVAEHGGVNVKSRGEGDSTFSVFELPTAALEAAADLQRNLTEGLRVRMAVYSGQAQKRDGDYFGSTVNRCARLRAIAQGGQVLVSAATAELVHDHLPPGLSLRDLGAHTLNGWIDLAEAARRLGHADSSALRHLIAALQLVKRNGIHRQCRESSHLGARSRPQDLGRLFWCCQRAAKAGGQLRDLCDQLPVAGMTRSEMVLEPHPDVAPAADRQLGQPRADNVAPQNRHHPHQPAALDHLQIGLKGTGRWRQAEDKIVDWPEWPAPAEVEADQPARWQQARAFVAEHQLEETWFVDRHHRGQSALAGARHQVAYVAEGGLVHVIAAVRSVGPDAPHVHRPGVD